MLQQRFNTIFVFFSVCVAASTTSYVNNGGFLADATFYNQHSRSSSRSHTHAGQQYFNQIPSNFIIGKHVLPPETIRITKTVAVKIPYPKFIPVPHNVPYPVPVPISKPFPVKVTKIVHVRDEVPVPIATNDASYGTQAQSDEREYSHQQPISYGDVNNIVNAPVVKNYGGLNTNIALDVENHSDHVDEQQNQYQYVDVGAQQQYQQQSY